ncbi:MAG: HAMP domain-containing sensor histidine kinase [Anaerolineae bacterium]
MFVNQMRVGTVVIDQALDQQRNQLLEVVNTALLLSGAISVALAVGIGWELSRRITRPVRDLMSGVRRLASGEWRTDEPSAELPVRAGNEIGELTRAFNGMANEITHQQRMNKQMVADIAHDLRTPLSAMALEIEAIEAGYQTPLEAADSLREEINWLQRLVDELRLLSLIDADQIKPQLAPTELTSFVCGIYDFWQTVAADARRELTVNLPAELPTIDLDPGRMRQVLGNLIDNAIRHTPAGGKIELGVSTSGKEVTLWVKDNGEGIPPDELPRVFDRFYRADRSRQHQKLGGSGLGLSIAKRLVELHGGTIAVSSTPGKGTTFTVSLPYRLS